MINIIRQLPETNNQGDFKVTLVFKCKGVNKDMLSEVIVTKEVAVEKPTSEVRLPGQTS